MNNVTYLPYRDFLAESYENIYKSEEGTIKEYFSIMSKRVIEHSEEITRLMETL